MPPLPIVESVMNRNVVVLREEDTLDTLEDAMERYRFRHMPVVDGKTLVGIVSQRDLLRASLSSLQPPHTGRESQRALFERVFIAQVMKREVVTTHPEASVLEASRAILANRVGALPVTNDRGELVGIVSENDLLLALVRYAEETTAAAK